MYGASGKMGRGRGGGSAGKRNIHAPPINRAATTGRLSMGAGPRGLGAAISSPSTSLPQVEESFSLVRENPLNFGMALKLTPVLVEEIKRVEAEGGMARIKLDANANNPNENIIQVGDKNFKFTWSSEPGDLCDIYEEYRSGEDGNGLLVESGVTWRKLNLERVLDESAKNHVKMRSEEAERKHKSRKAIVLDHQNPAMKNQMKAFAASESNQWRNFKHRKEPPFKKTKSESTSACSLVTAVGPSKSVYKPGLPTNNLSKSRLSAGSPLSSQPEQLGASTSPVGSCDVVKAQTSQNINKISSSNREITNRKPSSSIGGKSKCTWNTEAKPADLRSLMISLLQEHQSKGMSLKALEKAIGDAMPNSARKIEPILKQIANFQAPGRYLLKSGVMESFKKLSQSGSSPEINHGQSPESQKFDQHPAQDRSIPMATAADDEEPGELNPTAIHTTDIEKIDILQNSPEKLVDKTVSNNSRGVAGSSSDSGSDGDSESDSSDSGSDNESPSKSKSRSPVGSRSGSSSDSETDASSSSKQASDEDVDIMPSDDDDKEPKQKLQDSDPISSRNPVSWSHLDDEPVDIGNYDTHNHCASDVIEIEKDSAEDNHKYERPALNCSPANNEVEEMIHYSVDHHEPQEKQVSERKAYNEGPDSVVNDGFKHGGQSGCHGGLSKDKSERHFDYKQSDERSQNRKRSKNKSSSQQAINSIFGESPCNSSPDRPQDSPDKGPVYLENRTTRVYANDTDLRTGSGHVISTKPISDSQQPDQRSSEVHVWAGEKRPGKNRSVDCDVKHPVRNVEDLPIQKGFNVESQSEDGLLYERRPLKFSSEGVEDKHAPALESHNRKHEMMGKMKEAGPHSNFYRGNSSKDNNAGTTDRSPLMNGRSGVLQIEHSDLELGELREPFHEETPGSKKQFERKGSFKHLENKSMDSEYRNSDFSRGNSSNKITIDLGKLSPPNSEAVVSSIPDGLYKRKAQENNVDDPTRPHHRSPRSHQHHESLGDHLAVGSQQNEISEMSGRSRFAEAGMGRVPSLEAYGDASRKMHVGSTEQINDHIQGVGVGPHGAKEIKKKKPKMVGVSNDRQVDAFTGSIDGGQRNKVSSSDENISMYTKYEMEVHEVKGPIKNICQYKEYVKEYQEKYESYCSLSKILESYRDEFSKLGKDLDAYKGRDVKRYQDILEQMRSSFHQSGERHRRLKKIFIVLYEELKHLKQMIKDFAASYRKD